MQRTRSISVWFFIGVLVLIYGVLILGAGLYGMNDAVERVVLGRLHVDIWWGVLLILIGAFYTYAFRPNK